MTITELRPMLPVLTSVQVAYVTELHDCCDLDEFVPDESPPCLKCNHCSARHQDLPIGRGVCDVPTCECFHYSSGDDCEDCSGTGTLTDPSDLDYACPYCGGEGVTA
jgi:DNA-directed RNA polymerase subunit RPC12/RpoP